MILKLEPTSGSQIHPIPIPSLTWAHASCVTEIQEVVGILIGGYSELPVFEDVSLNYLSFLECVCGAGFGLFPPVFSFFLPTSNM